MEKAEKKVKSLQCFKVLNGFNPSLNNSLIM